MGGGVNIYFLISSNITGLALRAIYLHNIQLIFVRLAFYLIPTWANYEI